MKFSIITPSFNQGRFIRDCIESVVGQKAEGGNLKPDVRPIDIEHIIIDACSTDETVSVLKEYPRLNWVSEPDKGQTDAINKGFRKATGDWMMWLNADDYLLPGALEKVVACAKRHPEAEVIYGDCRFVDEKGGLLREKREGDFDFNMLLFYGCYIPSTATFYRRSVLERGLYLDDTYKVCMDFEYYVRLACAGCRFAHLAETLACFRWHETNVSAVHAQKRYQERLQVQRWCLSCLNRAYLGREWLLHLLFRAYQARRVMRRLLGANG